MLRFVRPCVTLLHDGESAVQGDLAITPSRMAQLTAQGRAISAGNLDAFMRFDDDNDSSPMLGDIPIDYRRGVDFVTVWEHARESRSRFREFKRAREHARHIDDVNSKQ